MAKVKGTKVIEAPWGGWSVDPTQSNSFGVVPSSPSEYTRSTGISLTRPSFFGCIAPAPTYSDLTDSGSRVTARPDNCTIASNGEAFSVLQNARVVEFGVGDDVIDANFDITMAGAHAAHTLTNPSENCDILAFVDASGTERILWSWEDNTDADIAMITSAGGSQDDDWFSTRTSSGVLTKGVPLRLWLAPNGRVCCTNGRYVATYDDVTATGNRQALDVNYGYTTVAGCSYGTYSAIIGYKSTTYLSGSSSSLAKMWLWNGRDPSFNFEYTIPDNYASRIENIGGTIYVWTYGRNLSQKLWYFTGDRFILLYETAKTGAGPIQGGGTDLFGHLIWGNATGNLLAWGSPNENRFPSGFHHIGTLNNIGFVKQLTSNVVYLGNKNSSTYTIKKTNYAGYETSSIFRSSLLDFPTNSTITHFKIYFAQFGTGASISLMFNKDYNGESFGGASDLLNTQLTNATLGAITYYHIDKTIDNVNAGFMSLLFDHASVSNTAAIVRRIEIDYEYETNSV